LAGLDRDDTQALTTHTPLGWDVEIAAAELEIAAIYFRDTEPATGTTEDQGRVSAQVIGPLGVDALNAELQPAAVSGSALSERALSAEIWLTEAGDGQIADALGPFSALAHVAGTASNGDVSIPFDGGLEFVLANDDTSYQTWLNRIIRRIDTDFIPREGGVLTLRVDPSRWFDGVTFDTLQPQDGTRTLTSDADNIQLRNGLSSSSGVYAFTWTDAH
jgi:hypothetical protein